MRNDSNKKVMIMKVTVPSFEASQSFYNFTRVTGKMSLEKESYQQKSQHHHWNKVIPTLDISNYGKNVMRMKVIVPSLE